MQADMSRLRWRFGLGNHALQHLYESEQGDVVDVEVASEEPSEAEAAPGAWRRAGFHPKP